MNILGFDIETMPHEAWVWGLYDQNIGLNQIKHPGYVASWSAKWFGTDETFFDSIERSTIPEMHHSLHALMSKADVVVTYNGKKFDVPWVQTGFVTQGLPPPTFQHIDLLNVVRRQFKFPSYKLEYVVKALGIGEKMANEGFELWKRCMEGDKAAWAEMEKYNIHDTVLLEGLYYRVLPYIRSHPNRSLVDVLVCPACGSTHYKKDGFARKSGSIYQKYACNSCGFSFRDTKNIASKERFMPIGGV